MNRSPIFGFPPSSPALDPEVQRRLEPAWMVAARDLPETTMTRVARQLETSIDRAVRLARVDKAAFAATLGPVVDPFLADVLAPPRDPVLAELISTALRFPFCAGAFSVTNHEQVS